MVDSDGFRPFLAPVARLLRGFGLQLFGLFRNAFRSVQAAYVQSLVNRLDQNLALYNADPRNRRSAWAKLWQE